MEFVLFGVSVLAHRLAAIAVAEQVGKPTSACFFQPPTLGRVDAEHLRDLGGCPVHLDGLDGETSGWVLLRVLAIVSPSFSMPLTI